jgi:hypothetical protein
MSCQDFPLSPVHCVERRYGRLFEVVNRNGEFGGHGNQAAYQHKSDGTKDDE